MSRPTGGCKREDCYWGKLLNKGKEKGREPNTVWQGQKKNRASRTEQKELKKKK